MTNPIPPHALAVVDQWKAELRQRLDVAIAKLRVTVAQADFEEADFCGPLNTYALMGAIEDAHGEVATLAALLAEAVSRLMNAEVVEVEQ